MNGNLIHIEPSSRCTLRCIQCPRTQHLSDIAVGDLSIDLIDRACTGYDNILLCGNHGDPIYHRQFHELIQRLVTNHSHARIDLVTNGSGRSPAWWHTTTRLLRWSDCITFSIDGMPWDNHVYRVNSKWRSIEGAIKAIRKARPYIWLQWKWILFSYNEHEIKQGMQLAKDLGFNKFQVVGSSRYADGDWLTPTRRLDDIREDFTS